MVMNMERLILLVAACMALNSCAGIPRDFSRMSIAELAAYNEERPVLKQIYCTEERRIGSHIRKTWCRTVEEWVQHNNRALMTLSTINVN